MIKLLLIINILSITNATSGVVTMLEDKDYVIPASCNFNSIDLPFFSNDCSPRIKGMNTGLVINSPTTVKLTDNFSIKIASTYSHKPINKLNLAQPIRNSIVFIAVNTETHIPLSGVIEEDDMGEESPDLSEIDPEVLKTKIIGGYVNADLVSLLGIPAKPATYIVYATVGPYVSNKIELNVTSK